MGLQVGEAAPLCHSPHGSRHVHHLTLLPLLLLRAGTALLSPSMHNGCSYPNLTTCCVCVCVCVPLRIVGAPSNSVWVVWLVPQYVLVTLGEVLVSTTGLEFAYQQVRVWCLVAQYKMAVCVTRAAAAAA